MVISARASTPAVVIAAPSSGSGKTTVTTGLIGALRAAGHRVAPFKVGPDYIDPGYHAVAAGRPGRNLDPNLVGAERIAPLFARGAAGADIAVVEGVMGLFDGRIVDSDSGNGTGGSPGGDAGSLGVGSTAHVASIIGAPVILVVDAAGHSQSLAAVLHGFLSYDPSVSMAGVILNRVGSPRHEMVLRQAAARVGLPVLGVLRRHPSLTVPSRHLGLIPAAERNADAVAAVDAMTAHLRGALDLPAIVAAARGRAVPDAAAWSAAEAVAPYRPVASAGSPVIAVAGGAAFTFGYAEHAEMLTAAGARVVVFDPLVDRLPADAAGVVIGGGFPEEHAEALAANDLLRADLRAHAAAGRPIHAECAGLLYLCTELDGHPMSGVLDIPGHFGPTLTLGYRDAVAVGDSALFRTGERVTGHEFHRSGVGDGALAPAWAWRDSAGRASMHGFATAAVHASYLHLHPAAIPEALCRFVSRSAESGRVPTPQSVGDAPGAS
ncbi:MULTISPECIES: cobyrinate a,c-diamide synthase [unclassified Gordonia (in: high G+C Gram-positive bacteria)]|uniref:cobyrinate a,c-diamide synthase n=1 Tax=unclassified Gordonia (in: high G+C Gram-positive bacteria) TaxID=2657482 RepID=UPI00071E3A53|nr:MULTISPECIES: cobyrinate a,c-diamide synthase [unclassified Gordonia (in: high G+C Gram-positive bacteria)]KSU60753.1 cobyrinic acid a,c-diamide synthase [Gordonia sp. SGD-V-85]SCB85867.1 cobyrinic acid a,c-diamide synthase [Gordonia sp. v-85]